MWRRLPGSGPADRLRIMSASDENGRGETPNYRLGIIMLIGVALGWGLNWPALKTVVSEVPVWQFRAVTGIAAAVLLMAIALVMSARIWPPARNWPPLLVASFFNVTSWFVLIAYGTWLLKAAHASILAFTMPVFAATLGILFLGERLSWARGLALLLAVGTVLVILSHDFDVLEASPWGVLITLIGAANWAIGVLVQKHTAWEIEPLALAGWQLFLGSIPIAVLALILEAFVYHEASDEVLWSSVYLVCIALVFSYFGWFTVVRIFPAVVASIGTLSVPIIGAVSSAIVLGDPFGWREIAALVMVVAAIALVFYFDKPAGSTPESGPPAAPEPAAEAGASDRRAAS